MQHSPEFAGPTATSPFLYIRRPGSNAYFDPAFVFRWCAPTGSSGDVLLKRGLLALVLSVYSMTSCLPVRTFSSTPHRPTPEPPVSPPPPHTLRALVLNRRIDTSTGNADKPSPAQGVHRTTSAILAPVRVSVVSLLPRVDSC